MGSFQAAGTSYATWSLPMMPIYLFYSMFGFQRVGDLIWQSADARARGFLIGCTAGRTTMSGEGLQHEDGHSHLLASVVPTVHAYDPAFAYEMATIIEHGIHDMYGPSAEDCVYYLTLYNENYPMPAIPVPEGDEATQAAAAATIRDGILRGIYRFAGPASRRGRMPERAPSPPDAGAALAGESGGVGDESGDGGRSATILFSGTPVAGCDAGTRHALFGLGRGGRGLVGHELQGATRRRPRSRALEPAPPRQRTASAIRDAGLARGSRSYRGRDRLPEGGSGSDRSVRGCALHSARHRRIRTLRYPRSAAVAFRGRRRADRGRRAVGIAPRPARPRRARSPRRSRSTGSTPRRRTHGSPDRLRRGTAAVRRGTVSGRGAPGGSRWGFGRGVHQNWFQTCLQSRL